MFFKRIDAEAAVVVVNGVFKQVDLYERNGELFVLRTIIMGRRVR